MIKRFVLFIVALAGAWASGAKTSAPTQAELDQVTARGRLLADYDQAAWQASDAVLATHPPSDRGQSYVCRKVQQSWTCAFGVLTPERDRFLIWYEATRESNSRTFEVKRNDPPREDTEYFLNGAKALALARKDFQSTAEQRPYNASVLPPARISYTSTLFPRRPRTECTRSAVTLGISCPTTAIGFWKSASYTSRFWK